MPQTAISDALGSAPILIPGRLIRLSALLDVLGVSEPTLRRMRKSAGFPEPVRLSSQAVGWSTDDVLAWIERRKGLPSSARQDRGPLGLKVAVARKRGRPSNAERAARIAAAEAAKAAKAQRGA